MANVAQSRNGLHDLDTTSKQRSRSFILVPIDFSYTTFYRLSIVTFALGRIVYKQYIPYRRQTQQCSITGPASPKARRGVWRGVCPLYTGS